MEKLVLSGMYLSNKLSHIAQEIIDTALEGLSESSWPHSMYLIA